MKKFIIALVALIGMVTSVNAESHTYSVSFHEFDGLTTNQSLVVDNIRLEVIDGLMDGSFYDGTIRVSTVTGENIKEVRITDTWGNGYGDFMTDDESIVSKHGGQFITGRISTECADMIEVVTE